MKADVVAYQNLLGVPLWRQPFPDESAMGLLLDLAERNGYPSARFVANCLGIKPKRLMAGDKTSLELLSRSIHGATTKLIQRGPSGRSGAGQFPIEIGGEQLSSTILLKEHRRACPECLKESRHHRFWWDLRPLTTCPRHGLVLVDRCSCPDGLKLSWGDAGVFKCRQCGSDDPATLPRVDADPLVLRADAYLLGRFGAAERTRVPVLDDTTLATALEIMVRVGAADIGGYQKHWQSSKTLGIAESALQARGFAVFADGQFEDLLERIYATFRAINPEANPSYGTAYGWLNKWVGAPGKSLEVIRKLMLQHAVKNFRLCKSLRDTDFKHEKQGVVSFSEVIKAHKLPSHRALSISIALGMTPPKSTGRPRSFTESDVERLLDVMPHASTAKRVKQILNVEEGVFRRLVALGLIKPLSDRRMTNALQKYDLRDVFPIMDRLAGSAPFVRKTREGLVSLVKTHIGTDAVCRLILEGRFQVVERLVGKKGLSALFIDPSEAYRVSLDHLDEYNLHLATYRLSLSPGRIREYLEAGHLKGRKNFGAVYVTAESIRAFLKKYISTREISERTGLDHRCTRRYIKASGSEAILPTGSPGGSVYEREPFERAIPNVISAVAQLRLPPRVQWVGDEALAILLKAKEPMSAVELFDIIGNDRMKLRGQYPCGVLRKILWLNRDRIEHIPPNGYWPKGRVLRNRQLYEKQAILRRTVISAHRQLKKSGRALQAREIFKRLSRGQQRALGKYAIPNLRRILLRHGNQIINLPGHGYWLRNEAFEAAGYRPAPAAAAK